MNIAHVVDNLAVGGLERLVVNLAKVQKRNGNKVGVFCLTEADSDFASELSLHGIELKCFKKSEGFNMTLLWSLSHAFRSKHFEVIHTHNPAANFYGAIAGKLAGVSSVVNTRHGMANFPFDKKRESIFKFSNLFTDRIVFVCNKARESFIEGEIVSSAKSSVVYNGIPLDEFLKVSSDDSAIMQKELGIEHDDKVIGTIARLSPVKGINVLLETAKTLLEKEKRIKFLIVGSGPEEKKLHLQKEQLGLNGKVIFLGKRTDVARLLSIFDVFVLPSLSEGLSLTLIEAMAAGKGIVATDVGGNAEVIIDTKTGFLVQAKNHEMLAEKIKLLLDDQNKLDSMRNAARKRACALFGIEKMATAYELLYKEKLST